MRLLFAAAVALLIATPAAADPPAVQTVLQQWREAMHAGAASGVAHARYAVNEDGLTGAREQWVSADRLRHVTDRRYDRDEILATPGGAWRKDWDGSVRHYNGRERAREITETLNQRALVFGPSAAFNAATAAETDAGVTLTLTPSNGLPTIWLIDAATHLPKSSTLDGVTTTYADWRSAAGVMTPGTIAISAGQDDAGSTYSLTSLTYERATHAMFAPLRAAPSDIAMSSDSVRVPFTIEANHIVFQTRINGHEPIGVLLDSGDGRETVNAARMQQFGLSSYGASQLSGGGNRADSSFVADVTFDLGGVQLRHQHADVLDLTGLERAWGVQVGAILGYDFLSRFVVELDYQNKVMTLHRADRWSYHGAGAVVPITLDDGYPYADATISVPTRPNIPARLLLDFGLADTMVFTRPYVEAHDLARLASANAAINPTAGLDNQFFAQHNTRGRLDELHVGALALSGIPVNFSTNTSGAYSRDDFAATLGNTVYSRYHVFLDYPRNRVIFEPTPAAATPFAERRTFGLTLLAGGDDLHTFTVSAVRADSPAAHAGFLANDVIAAVDGRSATQFTLGDLRDMVAHDGDHHVFHVSRGDQSATIDTTVATVSIER